jgi:hypothetical protein
MSCKWEVKYPENALFQAMPVAIAGTTGSVRHSWELPSRAGNVSLEEELAQA